MAESALLLIWATLCRNCGCCALKRAQHGDSNTEVVSILARTEVRALRAALPREARQRDVSILARTEVRALRQILVKRDQAWMFQSSPAPRCGRCSRRAFSTSQHKSFQSSPAPRCGRCRRTRPHLLLRRRFNPRPHRGAGAAAGWPAARPAGNVSILARTEVRALPAHAHRRGFRPARVSILARTEVRALHQFGQRRSVKWHVSILARTEVRALLQHDERVEQPGEVSILARTEVRALRRCWSWWCAGWPCFNPRPHRGAGAAGKTL